MWIYERDRHKKIIFFIEMIDFINIYIYYKKYYLYLLKNEGNWQKRKERQAPIKTHLPSSQQQYEADGLAWEDSRKT